jgi:hypothetical protein
VEEHLPSKHEVLSSNKNGITKWSSNTTSGYNPSPPLKTGSWEDICTPMVITALFTIGEPQNQPRYLWKDDLCHNTDESWIYCAKWNNQSPKAKYYVIPLIGGIKVAKFTETELARDQSRENGELLFNRSRVLVLQGKEFCKCVVLRQESKCTNTTKLCT